VRRESRISSAGAAVSGLKTSLPVWSRSKFERYNIKNEDDLREAAATVANEMGRNGQVLPNRAKVTTIMPSVKLKKLHESAEGDSSPRG
jgi:hypothetical protein